MKIKKLKIKLNKDNEYSEYRYFIPKSKNITLADGTDIDTAVDSLKARIAQLKEQASYLISKAPLVKYAEGSSVTAIECADAPLKRFTIEGDSYQESREGYNLLDLNVEQNEQIVLNDDGTVTINGQGGMYLRFNEITLKNGVTYKQKYELVSGNIEGLPNIFMGFDGSTWLSQTVFRTFTPNEDKVKSSMWIHENAFFENAIIKIWACENEEKPYEQYGVSPSLDYPSEVQSIDTPIEIKNYNTNLFIKDNAEKPIGNVSGYISTEYLVIKRGDVVKKNNNTTLFFYDKHKQQITSIAGWTTGIVDIDDVVYMRCNLLEKDKDSFMIVKNQELPKKYIEGEGQKLILEIQQPFRAIGDVKDRFVKIDDIWYEEHKILKFSLGSKAWTKSSTYGDDTWFCGYLSNSLRDMKYPNNANIMCNKFFKFGKYSSILDKECINNGEQFHIRILANRLPENSAAGLVSYLKDNPVYTYYELKTPTLIPCTSEQVEVLESLKTYINTTHIETYINDILYSNMKIAYKQDLNLLIEEGI